ncbi:MAG TPA: hypothetical protein VM537_37200 [Anaerolineae bacterium]|nr:hypothetical protein [Anaerolineae bacterium]
MATTTSLWKQPEPPQPTQGPGAQKPATATQTQGAPSSAAAGAPTKDLGIDFNQIMLSAPGNMRPTINAYGQEAQRLRDEEEERRRKSLAYLSDARKEATQASITPGIISQLFGSSITEAGGRANDFNQMLGNQIGGEGTFGGGAAGAAYGQVEAQRLQSLAQQQGGIAALVAQDRAATAVRGMEMDRMVAGVMGQEPSMLMADFLGQSLQGGITYSLGKEQIDAANKAAKASKTAGFVGGASSVLGAAAVAFL